VLAEKAPGTGVHLSDAGQLSLVDVSSPVAARQTVFPFSSPPPWDQARGGRGRRWRGNTPLADLYVGSIYNAPDANLLTLSETTARNSRRLRSFLYQVGGAWESSRAEARRARTGLRNRQRRQRRHIRAEDLSGGKPVTVATLADLPTGSEYASGHFRGQPLREFLFYKPGQNTISLSRSARPATPFRWASPRALIWASRCAGW